MCISKQIMWIISKSPSEIFLAYVCNRVCPRFFDQDGHETMYASSENKHFFTKSCHRQTYKNYEHPLRTYQNSLFQNHFSVLKIGQILPRIFSIKNIGLGRDFPTNFYQKMLIFKILYFLKYVCSA